MLQKQNIDWDKLGFNASKTRSMWVGDCINDETWSRGALEPYGNINISPAACVLNYAQGVFEGMKAYHTKKDRIVLFRPNMNANRMAESTEKMCIPKMVPDYFINAVKATTLDNIDFVPPFEKGAMYLRPIVFGTTPSISVGPSIEYKFIVFASPVGSYFPEGAKPLNMLISSDFHRAAPKGIGNAKAIGNYSASLFPGKEAKSKGYNDMIYLRASNEGFVEEMGSANIFAVKNKKLITPRLGGSILPGITRNSVIRIAKDLLDLEVDEGDLSVDQILSADEVFCTGTAVIVNPIGSITKDDNKISLSNKGYGPITKKLRETLLSIQLEEIADPFDWIYPLTD